MRSLVVAQISEVSAFQKSLYDLDRMHHAIKSAYEEDIKRLRQELESRGIPIPPATNLAAVAHPSMQQMRKPSLGHEGMRDYIGNCIFVLNLFLMKELFKLFTHRNIIPIKKSFC